MPTGGNRSLLRRIICRTHDGSGAKAA
jgi:hypothetical protein